jgi:hypothetical protein
VSELTQEAFEAKDAPGVYKGIWIRFKKWVDASEALGATLVDGKYLTRDNVDYYFLFVVKDLCCTPKSATRHLYALQHFAKNSEHVLGAFVVSSPAVTTALAAQNVGYQQKLLLTFVSAHDKLPTNTLTPSQELAIMMRGLQITSWRDFAQAFAVMNQTAIRGDLNRLLRLCDLEHDSVNGPGAHGEDKLPMLALIQQHNTGKKKEQKKRMMGMWRHVRWYKCGTGMIAASLACSLREDASIHFCHVEEGTNPDWYRLKLISWKDYNPMYKVFKQVYEDLGIKWDKTTHIRTQGIDNFARGGGKKEEIGQMSKHSSGDTLDLSYLPELSADVMMIAAGFSRRLGENSYLVDRWRINPNDPEFALLPDNPNANDSDLAALIWPAYNRWVAQHNSTVGALKWKCGTNFLEKTLPFLAKVLVQDGIYWIKAYPQHEVSRLLLSVFGERYVEWGEKQLAELAKSDVDSVRQQIHALNEGSQAAFSSINTSTVSMEKGLKFLGAQVKRLADNMSFPHSSAPAQGHRSVTQSGPTVTGPTRERMVELCPPATHNVPYFQPKLPSTLQALLEEHLRQRLEDFKGVCKIGWRSAVAVALSRRWFLFGLISSKSETVRGGDRPFKLQEAARQLDVDRGSMSVFKYYEAEKKKGSAAKKRNVNPVPGGRKRKRIIVNHPT